MKAEAVDTGRQAAPGAKAQRKRLASLVIAALTLAPLTILMIGCGSGGGSSSSTRGVTATIPTSGGEVSLIDVIRVKFASGTFSSPQTVNVYNDQATEALQSFTDTAFLFSPQARADYVVHVTLGKTAPVGPTFEATLTIPKGLQSQVSAAYGVEAFALMTTTDSEDEETLETFELISSVYDSTSQTIQVTLPIEAFSPTYNNEGNYEAIVTLAATPGTNLSNGRKVTRASGDACQASALGSPLQGTPTVSGNPPRYFNPGGAPHPITGVKTPHYGVDLKAAEGDPALAAADGTIEAVGFQQKIKNGKKTGWGNYVVVRHTDGGSTLYAHLKTGSITLKAKDPVKKGDTIAQVGQTGGATGPHLHFEYAPNGSIYKNKNKIDPFPCIGNTIQGSLTAGDNGNIADDSFTLYLNGLLLGTTTIGASNNIAIGNLRPGTYDLKLAVTLAPDNVGTWYIQLHDGLTFSDGSTYVTDSDPQGAERNFQVLVPDGSRSVSKTPRPTSYRPNPRRE